jgi:hypothetical protein
MGTPKMVNDKLSVSGTYQYRVHHGTRMVCTDPYPFLFGWFGIMNMEKPYFNFFYYISIISPIFYEKVETVDKKNKSSKHDTILY